MRKRKVPIPRVHIPPGVRDQPAWVFIGIMIALVGVSHVSGFTESNVSRAIGVMGQQLWGAFLTLVGLLLVYAVAKAGAALEKLALRLTTIGVVAYAGYLLVVVPFRRAVMTVALTVILSGLTELRVSQLSKLLQHAESLAKELKPDVD